MPQFQLAAPDLVMVALYVVFARRTQTTDDYFLAGRSLTWWLIGFSLFASNVSSSTLVGLSSFAFSSGISVYNYEWMAALVLIVLLVFFLPLYLKTGVYTMPEFLERRFDQRSRYYFSALLILMNIVIDTAAALYAGGLVVQILYPQIPLWQSVTVLGLLAGVYTVAGGLKAVVYTDAVQAVLLLVGALLVAVLSFQAVGGSWPDVVARIPAEDLSIVRPASDPVMPWPGLVTGVFLLGFYFWGTNQFMVQRTLGARDLGHARGGALFGGLLKLPIIFIMVLPGIFGRLLYPEADYPALAENPDLIFPTLMFDLLPVGVRGLIVTALIAAIMSSVDSTLNSASTLVTMDFVKKLRPDPVGTPDRRVPEYLDLPAADARLPRAAHRRVLLRRCVLEAGERQRCDRGARRRAPRRGADPRARAGRFDHRADACAHAGRGLGGSGRHSRGALPVPRTDPASRLAARHGRGEPRDEGARRSAGALPDLVSGGARRGEPGARAAPVVQELPLPECRHARADRGLRDRVVVSERPGETAKAST
jgi:SSS family transporter